MSGWSIFARARCQRYEKQLRGLREIASLLAEHADEFCRKNLSHSSKERLKQALRERTPD